MRAPKPGPERPGRPAWDGRTRVLSGAMASGPQVLISLQIISLARMKHGTRRPHELVGLLGCCWEGPVQLSSSLTGSKLKSPDSPLSRTPEPQIRVFAYPPGGVLRVPAPKKPARHHNSLVSDQKFQSPGPQISRKEVETPRLLITQDRNIHTQSSRNLKLADWHRDKLHPSASMQGTKDSSREP